MKVLPARYINFLELEIKRLVNVASEMRQRDEDAVRKFNSYPFWKRELIAFFKDRPTLESIEFYWVKSGLRMALHELEQVRFEASVLKATCVRIDELYIDDFNKWLSEEENKATYEPKHEECPT